MDCGGETDDDMYYSGEETDDDYDDEVAASLSYGTDDTDRLPKELRQSYRVLTEEDIKIRLDDFIASVSTVLSVSRVEASILLRHYNWDVSKVNDEWFADEEKVRKYAGLLENPNIQYRNVRTVPNVRKLTCKICFERRSRDKWISAACGHPFCKVCWSSYIRISINDGLGCLMLRCPEPLCKVAVGEDIINSIVSKQDNDKYRRHLQRSYIEGHKNIKWCPTPGCKHAIEYTRGSDHFDVTCLCSSSFCWNCTEEAHRPVECSTVSKWILKNSAESENTNWILANSKNCPKCKRPIEKNQGCMHMTCTPPCSFHFCWLCLSPWTEHGEKTGGYFACNIYEAGKHDGKYDQQERRREMAKNSIQRYAHYYERWESNEMSRKKALEALDNMRTHNLDKLREIHGMTQAEIDFIIKAWLQVVECRRVLKWTYAYGYYLPEKEEEKTKFFQYLQGEAESRLERLHQCAEQEVEPFLNAKCPSDAFHKFKEKLVLLTGITKTYFENLVNGLENGLREVDVKNAKRNDSSKNGKKQAICIASL